MLTLPLGVHLGCAKPEPVANPPPAEPEPEMQSDEPTLVVLGTARVTTTRDGHRGSIAVQRVMRGRAGYEVNFISEPFTPLESPAVYTLASEGDTLRLLPVDGALALPPAQAERIASEPPPAPPPIPPGYEADFEALRAHDQHDWTPQASPPKEAAARVFAEIVWIGRDAAEVERLIGAPMKRTARGDGELWEYAYHSGEHGIMRALSFEDGRVTSLFVWLTQ